MGISAVCSYMYKNYIESERSRQGVGRVLADIWKQGVQIEVS